MTQQPNSLQQHIKQRINKVSHNNVLRSNIPSHAYRATYHTKQRTEQHTIHHTIHHTIQQTIQQTKHQTTINQRAYPMTYQKTFPTYQTICQTEQLAKHTTINHLGLRRVVA